MYILFEASRQYLMVSASKYSFKKNPIHPPTHTPKWLFTLKKSICECVMGVVVTGVVVTGVFVCVVHLENHTN